ncbi:MAG: hypothetical protein PHX83_14485 [Acidobacteriia bacterium]|nr:hypothetical protein [Terriglobia bacterium]
MIDEKRLEALMGALAKLSHETDTLFFIVAKDPKGDLCMSCTTHKGPWRRILEATALVYEASSAAEDAGSPDALEGLVRRLVGNRDSN